MTAKTQKWLHASSMSGHPLYPTPSILVNACMPGLRSGVLRDEEA